MDKRIQTADHLKDIESFLTVKTSISQFIPQKLKSLIGDEKYVTFNDRKIKTAYLVDFMHALIMKYHNTKRLSFNLSSIILREKYGSYYNFYSNWLLEHGFIKLVSDYYVGKKAKTYRINEKLLVDCSRYLNTDRVLLKKYRKNVLALNVDKTNYNWIEEDIRKKIVNDLFYVDVDIKKAQSILDTLEKETLDKNEYSVECVKDKHIFFHFDKYGRCHTNFTVLKSEIRKECLSIDGEEIEEIDIRNSQPLFLAILIEKYNDTLNCVDPGEYEFFKDLVINGGFYSYYMDDTGIKNKKDAKKGVYKVLFGRNLDDDENYNFKNLFPTVYDFILIYKEHFGDYKALAYELQRSESNFLFNSIIREIMEYNPEIKLFTVHDSISYSKRYSEEVNQIFNRNINLLFT
ncbi:MAG: putative DNA polymerase I [uncultured marine phage]|uniref:Putative DNA polymerase I n=1 Tax=uncultured marine phage TaxID=707152 RepID=A0A8D9FR19_9VIRU|nr:MAG: putative DNA polymerase I [uncultured marine phage]